MKKKKSLRGFATLKLKNPQRMMEICAKGGRSAHAKGVAHRWTSEEARIAGKKGGMVGSSRTG
jgi:general stress protein YciG